MAKHLVPQSKHEEQLVALGRREQRSVDQRNEAKDEKQKLKSQRNEARREVEELQDEIAAGPRPAHKLIGAVGSILGGGAGVGLQHGVMDKTTLPVPVKKGLMPALGLIVGGIGVAVDGIPGTLLTSFGFGEFTGSAGVSVVKKVAGVG